jgi:hypothetical protein
MSTVERSSDAFVVDQGPGVDRLITAIGEAGCTATPVCPKTVVERAMKERPKAIVMRASDAINESGGEDGLLRKLRRNLVSSMVVLSVADRDRVTERDVVELFVYALEKESDVERLADDVASAVATYDYANVASRAVKAHLRSMTRKIERRAQFA